MVSEQSFNLVTYFHQKDICIGVHRSLERKVYETYALYGTVYNSLCVGEGQTLHQAEPEHE